MLLSNCSQKKNTFTSRAFHNLGAHYNGLYWANVNLDEAIFNIERAHVDDYNKFLSVFKYADKKASESNLPQLDKAIEKTNRMIQFHSMAIDGVEHCRWIDENYMTLGRAHFYKRDYYAAVDVFEYVVKMYPKNPVKYEAFLWLIRSYNEMNSVIKTGPILDLLKHDKEMPRKLKAEYYSVLSDYNLRTEKYDKARESLLKAAVLAKNKKNKGRYLYILAQLNEEKGDFIKAAKFYSQCARLHPSYEMEFNARLANARTFQIQNDNDLKNLKRELTKMIKDEKNSDYRDQIYYALGDISYRENDIPSALNYFKLSAEKSVANLRQKGISYLAVANIYFDKKDYKNAKSYFDSTIAFLPKDYKDFEYINSKKESLSSLINNLNIISRQDSLLNLASMDTSKIGKIIDEIIMKVDKEEAKKKIEKEKAESIPTSTAFSSGENKNFDINTSTDWYFYNPATVGRGIGEFSKKWGNRPLEDNWRRSSKEIVMSDQKIDSVKSDTGESSKIADNKKRAHYLKDIPFTDSLKQKANTKILEAYYSLGGIYKEDLQDFNLAGESFEEILKRYPNSKYTVNIYYQLYRIFIAAENKEKVDYYKSKILNEFPNSEYAKIILNPDYQKAMMASKGEIELLYGQTLSKYHNQLYTDVIAMVNKADSFYSASELMPKFALLRAYSIGHTKSVNEYANALQGVVAKYPKDPVKVKALDLLDHMNTMKKDSATTSMKKDSLIPASPYQFKDSAEHQCVIVLSGKKVAANDMKIRISNFNLEYFRLVELNVSDLILDSNRTIITVKTFPASKAARDYADFINQDSKIFEGHTVADYKVFAISVDNFQVFYNEKNVSDYLKFYSEYYINKKDQ